MAKDVIEALENPEYARWILPFLERNYARLGRRGWHEEYEEITVEEVDEAVKRQVEILAERTRDSKDDEAARSESDGIDNGRMVPTFFAPGIGRDAIAEVPMDFWQRRSADFIKRLEARDVKIRQKAGDTDELPEAGVPGQNNWVPLGPSVALKGQASGNPPVGGRTTGIAVAPGGSRVYAASADGGLWRSDDGGATWNPTMDGFDQNPTTFGSTSNACGAVAIDQAAPDRVYVGTGEADTWALWAARITAGLPSYRGVGAIRSDDGGASWVSEPTRAADPTLAGQGFFQLAVDPGNRENVVAATTNGLYQRIADGSGGWEWAQRRTGAHSSVVVCRSGSTTTFFAGSLNGSVFSSNNGQTWSAAGTSFPTTAQRISLAVQPNDPSVLYAYVSTATGFDMRRLNNGTGPWRSVTGLPALGGQQDFNLPIAVDPTDASIIYIAGSGMMFAGEWTAAIHRCSVGGTATTGYSLTSTYIGAGVHADVHVLTLRPDDRTELWCGNDGGLFRTSNATGTATFVHRNSGYATLCSNFLAQHPTELAVMLSGLQDNGTVRYTGEEAWLHVRDGDGGYPIIDWANPRNMMTYANGSVSEATDGAQSKASFSSAFAPPWVIMAEPIKTTPYNPGSPGQSQTVAFGAGTRLHVTTNFGNGAWPQIDTLSTNIFALAFASPTILYVGTVTGQVFRYTFSGGTWTPTRLDNVSPGGLGVAGLLTDIEVDPANSNRIWVTFGGTGDWRHVWFFNGTQWSHASGSTSGSVDSLIDVSHNAIVADRDVAGTLYAAADIGIWQSTNSGATWAPMSNGLPDAAVMDLQMHATQRMLRAGTHGRGVFEYKLDAPIQADVDVYARDTSLDVARTTTVNWLDDPETFPNIPVRHYKSRNIKVDPQGPSGFQTPTSAIDFVTFNDVIVDGSDGVVTEDPMTGTVTNRVYVEMHNRGITTATDVRVMLLVANSSAGLPNLPAGYQTNVVNGTPITTALWQTVGIRTATNLRNHLPQVLAYDLPSTMLPPPASLPGQQHHCLLALAHSSQDPFSGTTLDTDNLTRTDKKVAQRNVSVVAFPAGPSTRPSATVWARLDLNGSARARRESYLSIDLTDFPGKVWVVLPASLERALDTDGLRPLKRLTREWSGEHLEVLQYGLEKSLFDKRATKQMIDDVERVAQQTAWLVRSKEAGKVGPLLIEPKRRYPVFLAFQLDANVAGRVHSVEVTEMSRSAAKERSNRSARARVHGGTTYRLFVEPKK